MRDADGLGTDMYRLLGLPDAASPGADREVLDRLVEGRLDPGSAPPGYGGLARLLAAAAAPAAPEELAGERLALAGFAAVVRSRPPALAPRKAAVAGRVFTVKAAAAALVAALSVGGVAAAAGGLVPGRPSPAVDQAPATTSADATTAGVTDLDRATQGLCRTWQAGQDDGSGSSADSVAFRALAAAAGGADKVASYCKDLTTGGSAGGASAVGPDAAAAARAGLCRAWQAGQGAGNGRRVGSVAFRALAMAAGGADKVAGYCKDVTAGAATNGQGQASPPSVSAPPSTVPPPHSGPPVSTGPPASTGPGGQGQGGPPTTTG